MRPPGDRLLEKVFHFFPESSCIRMEESDVTMDSAQDDLMLSQASQITQAGSLEKGGDDKFVDHDWGTNLLKGCSKLYKDKEFVDITLVVEDREYACHRNVLAISSPFFMAMFSSDMLESHQEKITLHEIDPLTMELVLEYIYSGEITQAGSLEKGGDDKFVDHDWGTNLLKGCSKLYKDKEFVDITLVVEDREYACHRNVLAISSPFFMAIFSSDMLESHQEKITLHEIDPLTMELVLEYIYSGEITQAGSLEKGGDDKFVDHDWGTNLLKGCSKLYKDKEFVDITLVVEDREYACHRNVLAISSPFFMAIFSSDMLESHQEKITLHEIDPLTMELVLEYIYSGEITQAGSLEKGGDDKFVDHDWGTNLLKGCSKLYKDKEFVDITLVVEDREYACNRNVLAISSPFFMAMFSSDMLESHQEKITLHEIDPLTMELVLEYIYSGEITQAGSLEKGGDDKFVDHDWGTNLLKGCSKLYKDKEFVDITLVVEDREYACHRNVLAISSPFFMAMFSSDMLESHQEKITLHEIDPLTMELVLEYIYSGEVTLSEETVQNLLSAANRFQLLPLKSGCADFMRRHINVHNCIGVYFFARAHECEVLAQKAKEIINKQFCGLYSNQEFLCLPAEKVVEILSDDNIEVMQEQIIYEAGLNWVQSNIPERKKDLGAVMSCVRFANISSYYFCDRIDNNPLLKECESLRQILDEIKYFHMLRDRHQEMDLNLMPRKGMRNERCVMIIANPYTEDSLKKYNSIEVLLPRTGEVIFLCKLPHSLYTPGCAITGDNHVYLAGGAIRKINYRGSITTEGVSNNLHVFDLTTQSWAQKANMNIQRSMFSLTVVDGFAYAIAGQDARDYLSSVERYDPQLNCWTMVSPLPKAVRFTTSISYKGKLYVFGGETSEEVVNNVYRYDPSDDHWTELAPMSISRVLAGSVVHNGKIYIIGGNGQVSDKWKREFLPEFCVSSVEIYDPETNTWTLGPELPNALCGAGVVKYNGTILIVGGEDDKSWMAGLCWLKEEKGRQMWVEGQELPTVMSTFGCAVANIKTTDLKMSASFNT